MQAEKSTRGRAARRTFLRVLATLALVLVAAVAAVTPSGQAQAYGGCFTVKDPNTGIEHVICPPLYLVELDHIFPEPPCFCPEDRLVIAWDELLTKPQERTLDVVVGLSDGLAFLHAAANAKPAEVAGLRARALASFTAAAEQLRGDALALNSVGHLKGDTYVPEQVPWLAGAGAHLAAGESYLQRALADPKGAEAAFRLAVAEFDAAYGAMAENVQR